MTRRDFLNIAMELAENDNNEGLCAKCGETQDGVEPDARKYQCEACGAMEVYGAEEYILMFGC